MFIHAMQGTLRMHGKAIELPGMAHGSHTSRQMARTAMDRQDGIIHIDLD